jgi:hypothetical protein
MEMCRFLFHILLKATKTTAWKNGVKVITCDIIPII